MENDKRARIPKKGRSARMRYDFVNGGTTRNDRKKTLTIHKFLHALNVFL